MIVSNSNRFIFFKPLKVAGTSIEEFMSKFCSGDDLVTGTNFKKDIEMGYKNINNNNFCKNTGKLRFHSHTPPSLLYDKVGFDYEEYFKVSAIRNPWDMVVSYYWWCIFDKNSKHEIFEKDFVKNSKDTETKAIMRKAQTPLEVINAVKMLKV